MFLETELKASLVGDPRLVCGDAGDKQSRHLNGPTLRSADGTDRLKGRYVQASHVPAVNEYMKYIRK